MNGLKVVDALHLEPGIRGALRPGGMLRDRDGHARRLPRFFYQVDSWEAALATQLTPHFGLWEFMDVDVREAAPLRHFPRYIPCVVSLIAVQLELFRLQVGTIVRIAANGAYRSPAHALTRDASRHCWGTAVNVYRIGDEYLTDQALVDKYNDVALKTLPGVWVRPFGHGAGEADDHIHLDFGYATLVPPDAGAED